MALYYNITGELTQELISTESNYSPSTITLTNIEGTNKCTVDLYLQKKLTGKFYILKDVELLIGTTQVHNIFVDTSNNFTLYIKLTKSASETPAVDVVIV
jgi:hypothetical protein|tara:strand:- start:101 stop:400 length:300 start_codon:yes stop_codon:yes gene_type:complete